MKLLGSTKSRITKHENGEIASNFHITKEVLIHYNIANKNYQRNSRVLYTFVSSNVFGQLLHILPKNLYF